MKIGDIDVEELLDNWQDVKDQISVLEKKMEKYKKVATKIMEKKGSNSISSKDYILSKKDLRRNTIAKCDVPLQVWDKYSKSCTYQAFYLKKRVVKNK